MHYYGPNSQTKSVRLARNFTVKVELTYTHLTAVLLYLRNEACGAVGTGMKTKMAPSSIGIVTVDMRSDEIESVRYLGQVLMLQSRFSSTVAVRFRALQTITRF